MTQGIQVAITKLITDLFTHYEASNKFNISTNVPPLASEQFFENSQFLGEILRKNKNLILDAVTLNISSTINASVYLLIIFYLSLVAIDIIILLFGHMYMKKYQIRSNQMIQLMPIEAYITEPHFLAKLKLVCKQQNYKIQ